MTGLLFLVLCFASVVQSPLEEFEDPCSAHAASNAHRHHAVARISSSHLVQQRCGELCSGAPKRMTERDRSAVYVQLRLIDPKLLHHRERLRREGFVEFDQIYLIQ